MDLSSLMMRKKVIPDLFSECYYHQASQPPCLQACINSTMFPESASVKIALGVVFYVDGVL